jgi:Leucine-rich repeat (LRR) protein
MVSKRILVFAVVAALIIGGGIGALLKNKNDNSKSVTNPTNVAQTTQQQGTTLDYSNQQLTNFPQKALNRTDITSLNLSNNRLTGALPAEIKTLTNLRTLNVSNNRMTGVPAEIGQLKNLQVLNYNDNRLTGLPMELGNLTQLKTLDLRKNPNLSQQDLNAIRQKLTNTDIKVD